MDSQNGTEQQRAPVLTFHDVSRDCAHLHFTDVAGVTTVYGGLMPREEIDRVAAIVGCPACADFPELAFAICARTRINPDEAKLLLNAATGDLQRGLEIGR